MSLLKAVLHYGIACCAAGILTLFAGIPIPRKIVNYDAFPFKPYAFEKNGKIYEKIGVHKWKDGLPDASKVVKSMTRKKVTMKMDVSGMDRLIRETCIAEIVHWLLILLTPVYSLFVPVGYGVVFSAVYALMNLPFIIVQRYNRPRLIHAMQLMKKREMRRKKA